MWRRARVVGAAGAVLALSVSTVLAAATDAAKDFPSRPIRVLVPQNPGASNDTISRIVATKMSEQLGQQVVIDNRPGAGGTIAGEIGAHAAPDGHTLFATATASQVIGPQIIKNTRFDAANDFVPIVLFATTQNVLVVNPKIPVKSVKELLAHAKTNPGKLNMANAGAGTQSHLAGVLFAHMTGFDAVHVPYKGGGASVAATIAGEAQVTLTPGPAVLSHARAGRLRALASGGEKRSPLTPELPTIIESGVPGFISTGWIGFLAPKGTPGNIVGKLNATVVRIVNEPATRELMQRNGADPTTSTPTEFGKFIREEYARFGQAIRIAKLKAE
jgi:tripartite-type tricarboxylate transporter receptor subunit TctC